MQMGDNFFWQIYWEKPVLYEGLMIRSCQREGSFTNAFSSNLKTVNLNFFPVMKGYTFEDKALGSLQNYGSIYA